MYVFVQIIALSFKCQFTRHTLTSTRYKLAPISINNYETNLSPSFPFTDLIDHVTHAVYFDAKYNQNKHSLP